jgi:hypothetical protein
MLAVAAELVLGFRGRGRPRYTGVPAEPEGCRGSFDFAQDRLFDSAGASLREVPAPLRMTNWRNRHPLLARNAKERATPRALTI